MVMSKRIFKFLNEEDVKLAADHGIDRTLLRRRLNAYDNKWTVERAVTEPKQEKKVKNGTWEQWKECAVVKPGTFRARMSRGWTAEEAALTYPSHDRTKKVE